MKILMLVFRSDKMSLQEFFMPIVFSLSNNRGQLKVTCNGCRELMPLEGLLPWHVKGMIEYDGQFIPVIDPSAQHGDDFIEITNDSCVLVIGHEYAGAKLYTGIIAGNFEQILQLAISSDTRDIKACGTNMSFALEMLEQTDDSHAGRLLWHNHLLLREFVPQEFCEESADLVTC
jgi:hypothetical protein